MSSATEQNRLFLTSEEAKRILELFPGIDSGDWVIRKIDGWPLLVVEADLESETLHLYGGPDVGMVHDRTFHWHERYVVLPRQGQLQEMLEERGYRWNLGVKTVHTKADKYRAAAFTDEEITAYLIHTGESWSPTKAKIIWTGPTRAIALARALTEVLTVEEEGA